MLVRPLDAMLGTMLVRQLDAMLESPSVDLWVWKWVLMLGGDLRCLHGWLT